MTWLVTIVPGTCRMFLGIRGRSRYAAMGLLLAAGILGYPGSAPGHGDIHLRIDRLTHQLQTEGPDPSLLLTRAGLYRLDGDLDRALADLEQAAALDPALPGYHRIRGAFLHEAGRQDEALAALNQFLASHPEDGEALLTRARVQGRLGRHLVAAKDYDRALAAMVTPTPDGYLERAETLVAAGTNHLDRALDGLDEAMRHLGPIPSLQARAIELECSRRRFPAALERIQTLIDLSPDNAKLHLDKAEILTRAGRPGLARAAYHQALQALESLPPARRASPASVELEAAIRQGLAGAP